MIITAHGLDSVRLQYGNTTITCNPRSKKSKLGQVKGSSDVVLSSINHLDYAPDDPFGSPEDKEFRALGPGAYGKGDIMIDGLPAPMAYDGSEYTGAIYVFGLEDVKVCFCGPLANTKFAEETNESLGSVEVLFVPIGDGEVLGPADAYEFAVSLEPNLIIPIHYDAEDSQSDALKTFLNEAGSPDIKPVDKLTIKKKEIFEKKAEVVVLEHLS